MAAIVLSEHFQAPFTRRELAAAEDPFESGADAVQIIGDPALLAESAHPDWLSVDLGAVWHEMTGLPFVYAGWIGRRGFDPADAAEPLLLAAQQGAQNLEPLIQQGMATLGRSRNFMLRYLGQDLTYFMPEAEIRKALSAFGSRLNLLK
jgi:chorismate dehydratase